MKRKIITTADGSKTIQIEDWNEQYHSKHGAIQEAKHVFIKHGFYFILHSQRSLCHSERNEESQQKIAILEIGFGTGLNAFITCFEAQKSNIKVDYVGVEAYPVAKQEIEQLNYTELISVENENDFKKMHEVSWGNEYEISKNFTLVKRQQFFSDISDTNAFNLIYFDAFGARVQPQLWTETIFKIMYRALKPKGVLVTYSAKGSVRRAMQAVGFTVERLDGPPGKREMLRATKH